MPELSIVIVVMGIVFAIAAPSWFGVVESREVDSAANQMVSDLRLAHTQATNRLVDWRLEHKAESRDYKLVAADGSQVINRSLPENTKILGSEADVVDVVHGTRAITFEPDGEASGFADGDSDGEIDIAVSSTDGGSQHGIGVVTVTSRVRIGP